MADDDSIIERLARLEEKSVHFLDEKDAIKLMEHTENRVTKVQMEMISRVGDAKAEFRESLRQSENANKAALDLLEARLPTMISGAVVVGLSERFPIDTGNRRGWHPLVTYGGGGAGIATGVAVFIYLLTNGHIGGQ